MRNAAEAFRQTVTRGAWAALSAVAVAVALAPRGEAHKPITSPFTFNEDVFPIVRDRCAACHVTGGVAPMSLLTHADAVPWGESIKVELLSGHMPPWSVDSAPAKFRNVQMLTGREMNVLLTWVSGGTPMGEPEKASTPSARMADWPLGTPDLILTLPETVTLPADRPEEVREFVIPLPPGTPRRLRAVDLRPGTPAVVRSAVISSAAPATDDNGSTPERALSVWVPGDHPVALDGDAAFVVPPDAQIHVRIRYRKTWEYERMAMTDRSEIGLYFAPEAANEVRSVGVTAAGVTLSESVRAIALYPDAGFANVHASVVATRPNGSREELIAFRPNAGWARRYWFVEPVPLPAGTRITLNVAGGEDLRPPGALPLTPADPSAARVVLNVVRD